MNIYPKAYFKKVQDITINFLQKNNIKALILDVDNTLIDYNENLTNEVIEWIESIKKGRNKIIYIIKYKQKGKGGKGFNLSKNTVYMFCKKAI